MNNPNCDGSGPCDMGEVRLLPTAGGGNMILCNRCFEHELAWRKERNRELASEAKFAMPTWWECKLY